MSPTTIVVGWTPDEFGEVALHRGVEEARLRAGRVVVVNATRGDALVDERYADDDQLAALANELGGAGVEVDVRRSMGADDGDQVLRVADDVAADLVVICLRRCLPSQTSLFNEHGTRPNLPKLERKAWRQ